jgi:uncharacterized membrane protein YfcA
MPTDFLFYGLLLLVAFLYASVGHGGASGYLALMVFFSFSPETMKSTALILNIFVSLIAFVQYYRNGYFRWNLFWPFALTSIPLAFVGGWLTLDADIYKKILGVLLLFPVLRLFGMNVKTEEAKGELKIGTAMIVGAIIGLLSGMIGIGGGIILSPIILLLHWANMKQTAAVSALFIFVNSLAGLAGNYSSGFEFQTETVWLVAIAFIGGLAGSYFGAKRFNSLLLRKILALVLLIASVKLLTT